MELTEQFGANVRQLREGLGISQEELGFRTGLHRTYISLVERGKRSVSLINICRLAFALKCEPAQLLEGIKMKRLPGKTPS